MPIDVYIYKLLQYYQQLSSFSGTEYPPPSPAPPFVQSVFGFLRALLIRINSQIMLYFKILNQCYLQYMLVLFTLREVIIALPALY